MIEIRMPKEITSYKGKTFFGLTTRQFLSVATAITINIPLYFWGKNILGEEIVSWLVIAIALPIMLVGFYRHNDLPAEKYVYAMIKTTLLYPSKRIYQTENYYDLLAEQVRREKLIPYEKNKTFFKGSAKAGARAEEEKDKNTGKA